MKTVLLFLCSFSSLCLSAQDEFSGVYTRHLDNLTQEKIKIDETADCYSGQFIEKQETATVISEIAVECFMDGDDYFFLVISWDDLEFEISPLQWNEQGQVAAFELLAAYEMDEPIIFYRND